MAAVSSDARGAGTGLAGTAAFVRVAVSFFSGLILAGSWVSVDVGRPAFAAESSDWHLARRFPGDVPAGELGFRFGEPLDVDGDGHAVLAAGSRLKLQSGTLQNGTASVWSGVDGTRIRAWDGEFPDGLFGHWVLPIPDLDGDGRADLVITAPNARPDGTLRGVLTARSPKSGAEIWRLSGVRTENLGWHLALAGDQNGDDATDLFVGAPSTDGGRVYLVSGKDGTIVRAYAPRRPAPSFGWYVAAIGDLDGDGLEDLAVGAHRTEGRGGTVVGAAYAFSSWTGKTLHHWKGTDHLGGFGEVVTGIGDLDGDGRGEIAIASPRRDEEPRSHAGEVRIYSGRSGKVIRHWHGRQAGEIFGRMIVAAGDVDGDGVEDLAIGAPWYRHESAEGVGRVELRSGRDGKVLGELIGDEPDCWFGWHIRRAPDPSGRGRPALLISSLRHSVDGQERVGVLDWYVKGP